MIRALVGALVAGIVTALARQRVMLTASGQWVAFFLGVLAAAAGWEWAVLLIVFFVAAAALTRWREEEKQQRTERTLPRTAGRTARQVFANGATFVILALLFQRSGAERWALGALGALAAASADTWSTEFGTLFGGEPRSIWSARTLPIGMSGGVTFIGMIAGLAGAACIAGPGAALLRLPFVRATTIAALAGFAGGLSDSLIGGAFQSKRFCDRCQEWTERRVHPCGFRTKHRAGFPWVTNDLVNFAATLAGAATAMVLGRWLKA
jgi:uncharacterized protein (TIGR00297 family)